MTLDEQVAYLAELPDHLADRRAVRDLIPLLTQLLTALTHR